MAGSPLGAHAPDPVAGFDRHRFDSYGDWIDKESRKNLKAEGKHLGFGYAELRNPPEAKKERPFYVLEPAFTSGLLVQRKYDQVDVCGYKTEDLRSDPHHYPNHLEVKHDHHFKDFRRKSQNLDPREWKPDPNLAHLVTDDMVKHHVEAHAGRNKFDVDKKAIADFFDDGIRPSAHSVRELNCDLSCLDLPHREGGTAVGRAARGLRSNSSTPGKASPSGSSWSWCMGGRKPPVVVNDLDGPGGELMRTASLPQMTLDNSPSMLHGNMGGVSTSTFHGTHTRKFGGNNADQRKRGGKLARDGWAGCFPSRETRPG